MCHAQFLVDICPMMYQLLLLSATIALLSNPISASAQQPFCSAPIEGTLGPNVIRVVDDVSDEETCDKLCQDEEMCSGVCCVKKFVSKRTYR